jgi:hypothetical protein
MGRAGDGLTAVPRPVWFVNFAMAPKFLGFGKSFRKIFWNGTFINGIKRYRNMFALS